MKWPWSKRVTVNTQTQHIHTIARGSGVLHCGNAPTVDFRCTDPDCNKLVSYFGPALGIYVPEDKIWLTDKDWKYTECTL